MDLIEIGLERLGSNALLGSLAGPGILFTFSVLVYFVVKRGLLLAIRNVVARSTSRWDDELVKAGFFGRVAYFAPLLAVWWGIEWIPKQSDDVDMSIRRLAFALMILVASLSFASLMTAVNEIYSANEENRSRPIKGYLQVLKIVLAILSGVLIIATLMDRSPLIFFSGIGAMAAVLLLIFRDTLLSLVASIQLTGNDMVHVGDWIEMPEFGADGDVIDVALHTVKVQNWDKTVTTIPTHKLIEGSFKNWRFMSRSGGRRIKRAISIDTNTIRFLEEAEIERLGRFALIDGYIEEKQKEIAAHNAELGREQTFDADIRRLTNLGTLRAYLQRYLENHPRIHRGMTLMVRQLAPTATGVPLEIYCFTNTTDWLEYEKIQADIFDHTLALLPAFELRAFQLPAGRDLEFLRALQR